MRTFNGEKVLFHPFRRNFEVLHHTLLICPIFFVRSFHSAVNDRKKLFFSIRTISLVIDCGIKLALRTELCTLMQNASIKNKNSHSILLLTHPIVAGKQSLWLWIDTIYHIRIFQPKKLWKGIIYHFITDHFLVGFINYNHIISCPCMKYSCSMDKRIVWLKMSNSGEILIEWPIFI